VIDKPSRNVFLVPANTVDVCNLQSVAWPHPGARNQKIERMPYIHLPAYLFDHYPSEKAGALIHVFLFPKAIEGQPAPRFYSLWHGGCGGTHRIRITANRARPSIVHKGFIDFAFISSCMHI